MSADNYISGVCNIGNEEINKRKQVGIVGLILTLLTYFLFIYFSILIGIVVGLSAVFV